MEPLRKECSECRMEKTLEQFHQDAHSRDGRQTKCKVCRRKYHKKSLIETRVHHEHNWQNLIVDPVDATRFPLESYMYCGGCDKMKHLS